MSDVERFGMSLGKYPARQCGFPRFFNIVRVKLLKPLKTPLSDSVTAEEDFYVYSLEYWNTTTKPVLE